MAEGPGGGDRFFEALVGAIGEGVVLCDASMCIQWATPALEQLLGYQLEDMRGRHVHELIHPDEVEVARTRGSDPDAASWQTWQTTRRVRTARSDYLQFDCTVSDLTADDRVGAIVVVLRRSTDRFQAWETERRLRAIVENAADAVLVYGRDLRVTYASPSARAIFGDLDGTILEQITDHIDPEEASRALGLLEQLNESPGGSIAARFSLQLGEGPELWIEAHARNLLDDPAVAGIVVNIRDITAQVELQDRLEDAARRDPLTGLPNRTRILELLESALRTPERGTVAVLFLDLDRFKVVNDSFGHATGDRVLVELGRRLQSSIRWRGTVGRFGGDEYVVIAVVDAPEDAIELAEMLGRVAREPFTVSGPEHDQVEVFLSGSVGIALANPGDGPSTLLHHADAAMYRSKAYGPRTWELYDEAMREQARSRLNLESDLIRALDDGGFELFYQPIVEVATGEPRSFEALARWRHPRRGLVLPSEFIPVLEETGGIRKLGDWAIATACLQIQEWQSLPGDPIGVSVNLSPQQLGSDDLAADVAAVTDHFGIDPSLLWFEITETLLMQDLDLAVKALARLRDVGCRLALDDFGTGWSSLTYLRSVPVDVVKIDRSFIEGVADSPDDRAIVGSVVWLCRTLGKDVVAEGVETEAQYDALARLGCTHAQGFHISMPRPAAAASAWLTGQVRI